MRKVFLDDLPKKEGFGANSGKMITDWDNCIGGKVYFVYDDISGYLEIVDMIKGVNRKVIVKYNNETFYDKPIQVGSLSGCKIGYYLSKITSKFKYEIGDNITDSGKDIIITDKEYRSRIDCNGNKKYYKYTCNKCGYEGWMVEPSLKVNGCPCCSNKVVVPHINSIKATDPWMIDLGVSEEDAVKYTSGSGKRIEAICPHCGKKIIKSMAEIHKAKSIGCKCNVGTYPEKVIKSILEQVGVDFETEYTPKYLNSKRSDFYLPKYKLIIEADGILGHEGGKVHGYSEKTLEECIEIDNWKDEQHKIHGIDTIRINCFESNIEYIKNNVLKSKLNEMFDLSKVDFVQADLFAIKSNRVKEVCDYWNNKEEWETTTTIAKNNKWGIKTNSAIKNYLKKGAKLGWCNYDPREEVSKIAISVGRIAKRLFSKCVYIFKDGVCLGIFESGMELERQSEELFGTKLLSSGISSFCSGKYIGKTYKGFTFKYNDDKELLEDSSFIVFQDK